MDEKSAGFHMDRIQKALLKRERKLNEKPSNAQLFDAVNRARTQVEQHEHRLIIIYNFLRTLHQNATRVDPPPTNEVDFTELTHHLRELELFLQVPKSVRRIEADET